MHLISDCVKQMQLSFSSTFLPPMLLPTSHTGHSYPDPMVGASRSFIHRISELSSLEGDTVRQEKLKKMRKPRKPPS